MCLNFSSLHPNAIGLILLTILPNVDISFSMIPSGMNGGTPYITIFVAGFTKGSMFIVVPCMVIPAAHKVSTQVTWLRKTMTEPFTLDAAMILSGPQLSATEFTYDSTFTP